MKTRETTHRSGGYFSTLAALSSHAVGLEPVQRQRPAFFGRRLAVAGPVVGMEGMRRVGEDHELRAPRRRAAAGQRLPAWPPPNSAGCRRPGRRTGPAPAPCSEPTRSIARFGLTGADIALQPAVPGHAGLQRRVVRGIQPDDAPAPAEAGDAQPAGVGALLRGPGHGGVEVADDLRVGRLGHHLGDQLGDLAVGLRRRPGARTAPARRRSSPAWRSAGPRRRCARARRRSR